MPAAASGSRPELERRTAVAHGLGSPRAARLRAGRDFEAGRAPQFRAALRWVGLSARIADLEETGPRVRIGVAAGKRVARKSVQRNLVKRILREAARRARPRLTAAAGARRIDVVLRLRAALPSVAETPLAALRRALRGQADALLQRLTAHLEGGCP